MKVSSSSAFRANVESLGLPFILASFCITYTFQGRWAPRERGEEQFLKLLRARPPSVARLLCCHQLRLGTKPSPHCSACQRSCLFLQNADPAHSIPSPRRLPDRTLPPGGLHGFLRSLPRPSSTAPPPGETRCRISPPCGAQLARPHLMLALSSF